LVAVAPSLGETPLTTAFTYQGQLKQGGAPFDGTADFQFTLWDAAGSGNPPTGGTQVGGVQAINALPVTAGLFTVALNAGGEFGANAFNGSARWLQVAVRSPAGGGGSFTTLAPRQPLTPTPHALQTRGIYVDPAQRAGIGTLSPTHTLTLQSTDSLTLRLIGPTSQYGYGGRLNFGDGDFVFLQEDEDDKLNFQAGRFAFSGGYVGVGTIAPASPVDIVFDSSAQTPQLTLRETDLDYARLTFRTGYLPQFWTIAGVSGGQAVNDRLNFYYSATGDILSITGDGKVGIGTTSPSAKLDVNGTARVKVLEIMGADLSEKFPVSEVVEPGMVVEIDTEHPGKLRLARGGYNRRVAGVASGANGLSVGAILGNLPGHEDAPPIALSGRVWVYCDASNGPIQPGDLLTTSPVAGHAMKVMEHDRAQGAIIGKAMTGLRTGEKGLVLVLVTLQ
ncbi:MAG: hypothetical protein AAB322_04820, partial [Pseudomonadota bacterium]